MIQRTYPEDGQFRPSQSPVSTTRLLLPSRSGISGSTVPVVVIGGTVRVAVVVAACSLFQPLAAFGIYDISSRRAMGNSRPTVAVGVMICVAVGLIASGGWGVVSAAIVVALTNVSVNVSGPDGSGSILGCCCQSWSRYILFRMIEAS